MIFLIIIVNKVSRKIREMNNKTPQYTDGVEGANNSIWFLRTGIHYEHYI